MLLYLVRRVLCAAAIARVCFMLMQIAPGDPIIAIVPANPPREVVDQIRRDYGLNKPLPVQFGVWLAHVAVGGLGRSLATGRSVSSDLSGSLRSTLGCLLGGLKAASRGTWVDRAAIGLAIAGISV